MVIPPSVFLRNRCRTDVFRVYTFGNWGFIIFSGIPVFVNFVGIDETEFICCGVEQILLIFRLTKSNIFQNIFFTIHEICCNPWKQMIQQYIKRWWYKVRDLLSTTSYSILDKVSEKQNWKQQSKIFVFHIICRSISCMNFPLSVHHAPGIPVAYRHASPAAIPQNTQQTHEISIPNDLIGCIIGRGGQKINEIR